MPSPGCRAHWSRHQAAFLNYMPVDGVLQSLSSAPQSSHGITIHDAPQQHSGSSNRAAEAAAIHNQATTKHVTVSESAAEEPQQTSPAEPSLAHRRHDGSDTGRRVVFNTCVDRFEYDDQGVDRQSFVPNIFTCDMCGRQLEGGLRGFEVYLTCWICDEFDCCAACAQAGSVSLKGTTPLAVTAHCGGTHPFVCVDRSCDPQSSQVQCDMAEAQARALEPVGVKRTRAW